MKNTNNIAFNDCSNNERIPFALWSNTGKIDKALQFLSLPEIRDIPCDATKVKFLNSRGLSHDEVTAAFARHYAAHEPNFNQHSLPRLCLRPIANEHSDDGTVATVHSTQTSNALSKFFSFCQKLVLFAGIASSFYYAYLKWTRAKDAKKKTDKNIRDEINHLRNEITKISNELRNYQLLERNNATLLTEVNSLKAILVGRQQFEEKQTGKVALPSWQLNGFETSKAEATTTNNSSKASETAPTVNGQSCQIDKTVLESISAAKVEDIFPVTVSHLAENESNSKKITSANSDEPSRAQQQKQHNSVCTKETKKNPPKSNVVENEQKLKKNDKKN